MGINVLRRIFIFLALSAAAFLLFIWKTASIPVFDMDTVHWADLARQILQSGQPLPYDDPYYQAPLFLWMLAVGFKLWGVTPLGAGLLHGLTAVALAGAVYLLGLELYGRRVALLSMLVFLTAAQTIYQARAPLMDVPLALFICLSISFGAMALRRRQPGLLYASAAASALAVLTKGLIGVVLPVAILFIYVLTTGRLKAAALSRCKYYLAGAAALFLAMVLPWLAAGYLLQGGRDFLQGFFVVNIMRFFRPIDVSGRRPQFNFYYYIVQIFPCFLPWSGFIVTAIINLFRQRLPLSGKISDESRLLLAWLGFTLILFSVSGHVKIIRYIFPLYPALSVAVGKLLGDLMEARLSARSAAGLVKASAATAILIALPFVAGTILVIGRRFDAATMEMMPLIKPFLFLFAPAILLPYLLFLRGTLYAGKETDEAAASLFIARHITAGTILMLFLTVSAYCLLIMQAESYLGGVIGFDLNTPVHVSIPR